MPNLTLTHITIGTALILLIPLTATFFTQEVNWGLEDFIIIGALLFSAGLVYKLITQKITNTTHRIILALALILMVIIIWIDLAVGIFNIPGISGS